MFRRISQTCGSGYHLSPLSPKLFHVYVNFSGPKASNCCPFHMVSHGFTQCPSLPVPVEENRPCLSRFPLPTVRPVGSPSATPWVLPANRPAATCGTSRKRHGDLTTMFETCIGDNKLMFFLDKHRYLKIEKEFLTPSGFNDFRARCKSTQSKD